ncbi:hypothetical protein GE09DRAFT_1266595 [Coniochaeta sp. 2T2.1]|nr:hypothetical protein GE09DRAFT_1266595 [Coniochaeta sp. 2T2.1]
MMFFSVKTIITCLVAATCARAHMFLASPVRFIQDPVVTNGPLLADGTNFPCQAGSTGKYTVKEMNVYPLGSQQTIAFVGNAVHGGGSGQFSLTYDTASRPDSVFKVLKSFEGGFVAKGQTGNIGNDANAPDPYTYTFDIPEDLPTGNATVAITWFNKVGNREMYMMCAPVTLTGSSGGGSQANFDALPDMFTANIGRGCGTQDSTDVVFPDPGQVVERNNGATTAFATPTGSGCQAGASRPSGTAGPTGSPAGFSFPAAGSSNNGGTFATTSAPAAPPASISAPGFSGSYSITASGPATTKAPAPPTTSAAPPSGPTTTAASGSGSGSGGALSGSCTTEGEFNCIDGAKYQQCGSGRWSVAMPVAPGTKCAVGRAGSLNVVPGKKLRFMGRRVEA